MRTFIKGGLVIDSTGREPLRGGVVAIEEGRIAAVGAAGEFPDSADGVEVIDATGCTVLPGLVDSHVHVLNYARRNGFSEAEAGIWAANYLQAALRGGVTTVRDLGAQHQAIFALRKGVQSGWFVGPRVLTCGSGICMTGGHGHDTFSIEADGPDGVKRAARQQIKAGADVVKFMATGGSGTLGEQPTAVQLGMEEMRAGVEEAHKAGLPTAVHATSTGGIKNGLRAGIDSLEHGCYLDDEAIELMLKNDVAYSPTLSIYQRVVQAGKAGQAPDWMARRAVDFVAPHRESFRRALQAGVRVVLGTDSGSGYHPLGDAPFELELWVEAGMKPLAALQAATRLSAASCQIGEEVGTLEPGKRADVVIVLGDALADIKAMRDVRRVLRNGITAYDAARPSGRPVMGPLPAWLTP